MLELLSCMAFT